MLFMLFFFPVFRSTRWVHTTPVRCHTNIPIRYHSHTLHVCEIVVLKIVRTKGQNEKINNLCWPVRHARQRRRMQSHSPWFTCTHVDRHLHIGQKSFFARHTCETCISYVRNKSKRPSHWSGRLISRLFYFLLFGIDITTTELPRTNKMDALHRFFELAVCEDMSKKYFQHSANHRSDYQFIALQHRGKFYSTSRHSMTRARPD